MRVLLDCDDVLLNWVEGFRLHLKREHGVICDGDVPSSWMMSSWTGLSDERTFSEILAFNNESPHFANLNPVEGAVTAINELQVLGYSMDIITSCSDEPSCVSRRLENLENVFGNVFGKVHIVPLGQSKKTYLGSYDPSFWVEDNVANAIMGHNLGHASIVRRVPHNRPLEEGAPAGIRFVNDWKEILGYIKSHDLAIAS
jgi:5'(3')-deoxyribonucleotidase